MTGPGLRPVDLRCQAELDRELHSLAGDDLHARAWLDNEGIELHHLAPGGYPVVEVARRTGPDLPVVASDLDVLPSMTSSYQVEHHRLARCAWRLAVDTTDRTVASMRQGLERLGWATDSQVAPWRPAPDLGELRRWWLDRQALRRRLAILRGEPWRHLARPSCRRWKRTPISHVRRAWRATRPSRGLLTATATLACAVVVKDRRVYVQLPPARPVLGLPVNVLVKWAWDEAQAGRFPPQEAAS